MLELSYISCIMFQSEAVVSNLSVFGFSVALVVSMTSKVPETNVVSDQVFF